ncbi:YrhA family protein [Enterobacter asburiae]
MESINFKAIDKSIEVLKKRMITYNYPVATPLAHDVQDFIQREIPPAEWEEMKKNTHKDIKKIFEEKKDIKYFYDKIDGFEYNAATIYGFSQVKDGELLWSNIYTNNFYFRDNEVYVDPDLAENIVIGEDSISYFVYDIEKQRFEVRDRVATDYIVESYINFNDLLKHIIISTEN